MSRIKSNDCCCSDWKSIIKELWAKYQNMITSVKADGTTYYPDGDGQVDITDIIPSVNDFVTDEDLTDALSGYTKTEDMAAVAISGDYYDLDNRPNMNDYQEKLISGINIKTVNGNSLLGAGNLIIGGGSGSGDWGDIGGNINDQTDLMTILNKNVRSIHVLYGLSTDDEIEPAEPVLPIGYKELSYIESNQQGGIITDYYFKSGDTVEVSCHPASGWAGNSMIYGATDPNNKWNMLNQYGNGYEWYLNGSSLGSAGTNLKDVDIVFKSVLKSGDNHLYRNGVAIANSSNTHEIEMSTPMSFMQLTTSNGTTTSDYFKGKLYYAKIYDSSDNVIHNYIPALRDSDSVPGLYDTVTDNFYPANGTVTYMIKTGNYYGTNIEQPDATNRYLWGFVRYSLYDGSVIDTTHNILREYIAPSALNIITYGGA